MPRDAEFGVFEMGMNNKGEIAALTRQVRPHVALVTSIAPAHIENLGSEEAIADAKAEIFEGLEPPGIAIVPNDTPHRDRLVKAARRHAEHIVTFGGGDADVHAVHAVDANSGGSLISAVLAACELTFTISQRGDHWVSNALAVLAAVEAVGEDVAIAGLALADLGGLKGRGERHRVHVDRGVDAHASARRCGAGQGVQFGWACQARRPRFWRRRMLYVIAAQLHFASALNLIRYITFRAGAASATALLIGLLLGPKFISWLRAKQGKGQPIRSDGPQSHLAKRGTPTMGGLLILTSVAISVLLWMDLRNPYVWACLLVTAGFGVIGWLDDYDKVKKAHHKGLSGRVRLLFEFAIAGFATWLIVRAGSTHLYLPFVQGPVANLGWYYV